MREARPLLPVFVLGVVAVARPLPAAVAAEVTPRVPDVAVSAGAAEAAPRVEARIAEVTVYSDRARLRRRGRFEARAGVGLLRLPDLPGAALLDTVRVSAGGARVLRVEVTPVERQRPALEQARKLLDELDAANDRAAEVDDQIAATEWEVGLLDRLSPAPPVPEEKREGRKGLLLDATSWWQALDFVGKRSSAERARLVRLADDQRAAYERRDKLRADLSLLDRSAFAGRVVEVLAVIEARAAGPLDVQLEYFMPGARWKPSYDLHYASARGLAHLETAAVVEQTTGEDWEQAALSFSTAVPGRGVDLPELLTWTLGEKGDFVPQLRPQRPPPIESWPAVPAPSVQEGSEARAEERAQVTMRLALATRENRGDDLQAPEKTKAAPPPRRKVRMGKMSPMSAPAAPPPSPLRDAPAISRRAYAESEDLGEEESPPRRFFDIARSSSVSYRSVPLALNDSAAPAREAPLTDPFLPAVSGGGLDYVYQAPTPATVPSTGKQIHIPLAAQTFAAATFYEATPALAATAFLRARVRNDGSRPLLRGPAVIFGDGELVGQGEIQTTGPRGEIELPLGADQDIRLVRQVVPSSRTTGLIMKSDETVYDVQIQIGNYKKQAATVEVLDLVPKSGSDKIEVKLLGADPAPVAAPDADGTVRFRVDVPAGATRVVRLRYQITRPKDWRLYQR
jgi:hypothetical protein